MVKGLRNWIALGLVVFASSLYAQQTLYIGAYGGSTEKVFRQKIIPAFEAKASVKVVYVSGTSTDLLAKLQAQRAKPEFDVVLMDEGPMYQAVKLGFCAPLAASRVYEDLYPIASMDGHAVGIGIVATGLAYNREAFKAAGWSAPTSWEALTDTKYKQKIAIPPVSNTYGLQTLLMFAKLRQGGQKNIDPGFIAIQKDVEPNVLAWEPASGKIAELFQQKDIVLAVWGSGRAHALQQSGFPIDFVYPKEGAMALLTAACPVAKSNPSPKAQALIQYLLQPEVQDVLAERSGWGPANRSVKLPPNVASYVPYGEAQVSKLVRTDWSYVNEKRAEWTHRWNRTIER